MSHEPLPCNLKAQDRPTGCDPPAIVEVVSDDEARELFLACDEPKTAKEIATECDVPISTVYRKLDQLTKAGMLTPAEDPSTTATRYTKSMDCISITYDDPIQIECVKSGLTLSCEV
ncbi:winged helix-turn-helix domain-containing protein [Natrarchaeobius oligotrophus]|uniref:winged helix-turn-helix domain-containing protein n=1 Tax=Natrarchaeobius oligotrophus TaxID=3455743 RepID=UPI001FB4B542|nr:helix-turn-helix domain-containing protein [Natrarchaeobius chitinivorans]